MDSVAHKRRKAWRMAALPANQTRYIIGTVGREVNEMSLKSLFDAAARRFRLPAKASRSVRQVTLVEIANLAERDELDGLLAQAGLPPVLDDKQPPERQKWSEVRRFDRSNFDTDAYRKSLDSK
jgi:hypothetical protein